MGEENEQRQEQQVNEEDGRVDVEDTSMSAAKEKDDNAESSSTGSSEGKSGSGGGYSADCSASDQSSDDTGGRKEGSSDVKLSVDKLSLGDNRRGKHKKEERGAQKLSDDAEEEDDDGESDSTINESVLAAVKAPLHHHRKHPNLDDGFHRIAAAAVAEAVAGAAAAENGDVPEHSRRMPSSDVEAIQRNLEQWHQQQASMPLYKGPPPQLGGVRITHTMDPRIDLSTVGRTRSTHPVNGHEANGGETKDSSGDASTPTDQMPSIESYLHLMEVVRPFFHAQGVPYGSFPPASAPPTSNKSGSGSEQTQGGTNSSEGFTSFFTTTHSSVNNSGSNNSASEDRSSPQAKARNTGHANDLDGSFEGSDTSSMVVLAPGRRNSQGNEEQDMSSSSARDRRVRIQVQQAAAAAPPVAGPNQRQEQESSMSSSSSERRNQQPAAGAHHFGVPPRIVTDVSSSNRTDTSGSNTQSGSGSGSAGNTGSGSNQGSSGSGNDGKGSSEDVAKEDNSGEGTNEGSDEASDNKKLGLGLDQVVAHRHDSVESETLKVDDQVMHDAENVERERKLLDKKRKRKEMRREYEAQQQSESSENGVNDCFLKPGKPVTLDQVMMFSKIPRIILQATPPFLVVHTNAAYSRLTGIESHHVVGGPITNLLSVPDASTTINTPLDDDQQASQAPSADASTSAPSNLAAAAAAGRARASQQNSLSVGIERLVAASGFGKLHVIHAHGKPQHLLGNVSIPDGSARNRDEGSNDTSLTGSENSRALTIVCRSSIAPVVSASVAIDSMVVSDKEMSHPKAKRRKTHGSGEQEAHRKHSQSAKDTACFRKHHGRQTITHYVIQLQPQESFKDGSEGSLSSGSTSVEARLLGLTKAQLYGQRKAVGSGIGQDEMMDDATEEDAVASESTKEPVAAIG